MITPEKYLCYRVLERAILDFLGLVESNDVGRSRSVKRDAWKWIFISKAYKHPFTYLRICEELDLCPIRIRKEVLKLEGQASELIKIKKRVSGDPYERVHRCMESSFEYQDFPSPLEPLVNVTETLYQVISLPKQESQEQSTILQAPEVATPPSQDTPSKESPLIKAELKSLQDLPQQLQLLAL